MTHEFTNGPLAYAERVRGVVWLMVLVSLVACAPVPSEEPGPRPRHRETTRSSPPPAHQRDPVSSATILALLDRVTIVGSLPYAPGYDRACQPGRCVFGPEWTDAYDGPFGRNGCDTREDVVRTQFQAVELRWGSHCRIYEGVLWEPYTGERMTWRDDGYWIHVDHVYPLAAAWHAGAHRWTQRQRVVFANDVRRELLAVAASANQDKGALTPGQWLPPHRGYHCEYVWRYLRVAVHYQLPITQADEQAIRRVAAAKPCRSWRGPPAPR